LFQFNPSIENFGLSLIFFQPYSFNYIFFRFFCVIVFSPYFILRYLICCRLSIIFFLSEVDLMARVTDLKSYYYVFSTFCSFSFTILWLWLSSKKFLWNYYGFMTEVTSFAGFFLKKFVLFVFYFWKYYSNSFFFILYRWTLFLKIKYLFLDNILDMFGLVWFSLRREFT